MVFLQSFMIKLGACGRLHVPATENKTCQICIGNSMICSDIWHKYHDSQVAKGSDLYRADKSTKLCMVVA